MSMVSFFARWALLAALSLSSIVARADPTVQFDAASGSIVVSGLGADEHRGVADTLKLQVKGLNARRSMPMTLAQKGDDLIVQPRFALLAGTAYVLSLGATELEITPPASAAPAPNLVRFAPSQSVIPANTLRLYLHFSEPMAQGQLRDTVHLYQSDGAPVPHPFLNLGHELWDPSQTRATLLLDPGRIKQGVGPNAQVGPPLEPGQKYHLVISGQIQSAAGVDLGNDASVTFSTGEPERRAVDPHIWQILPPRLGGHAQLTIAFDRIMDSGAARRLLTVLDPDGEVVRGRITTDGGGWSMAPDTEWQAGTYTIVVDPELEDVAGNTLADPFDAAVGTIGKRQAPITLSIDIRE